MTTSLLVMRHGEKSGDPNDPHLTAPGLLRANKLAAYIPSIFGVPTFIFATANSLHSSRPYETVKPLAEATGVPIDATFADQDYGALALRLRMEEQFKDTVGVVCWHHGNIPSLMNSLHALDGQYPNPWAWDVFNLILLAEWDNEGAVSTTEIVQPF